VTPRPAAERGGLRSRLRTLLFELRRRRVFRVMAAYAIVALAVAEGANNLLPPIGLDWGPRVVVILLLVGFPVTLALSWVFDITPRGIERTAESLAPATPRDRTGAVALGEASPAAVTLPPGSIATLPLANLSGDPAQDYLSDGLTEELIVALSRVPGLRVAARTSCFALRNADADVRTIGRRLGVRHVLEGGVRTAGNRLRLSVQLVDVETGYAEWSETYERQVDDLFEVQRSVAQAIVERVTAGSREAADAVAGPGTSSLEAYHHLLRGRHHWNRRTESALRRAVEEFEKAIALDPGFARARAGLADALSLLLDYGALPAGEALPRAIESAEHALRLDAGLAEGWTSLALVREFEWRWEEAETAFRRSIELRPDYATAHQRFALHQAWLGRPAAALAEAKTAEQLDPLSAAVLASTGFVLYYGRRYELAAASAKRALELDPHFATARTALGLARLQQGRAGEAVDALQAASADSGRAAATFSLLACAHAAAGRSDEAKAGLAELQKRSLQAHVPDYYLALPRLSLGDRDGALGALERACAGQAPQMAYVGAEPLLDPLREDPRFVAMLDRTGLR
jgi:TolB-like protein/Tfp pilus assembly protein PilF